MRSKRKTKVLNGAAVGCLSLMCYLIAFVYSRDDSDDSSLFLEFTAPEKKGDRSLQTNAEGNKSSDIHHLLSTHTGRSKTLFEPYRPFIVLEERLELSSLQKTATVTEYSKDYELIHYVTLPIEPPEVIGHAHYIKRNPASKTLVLGNEFSKWEPSSHQLRNVSEYFKYLHKAQSHCRKLVRLGGSLQCAKIGDDNNMDGHKLTCFDPELELLRGRSPKDCLVFSYGVSTDVTFDEAVSLLPCEIHMFDLLDFHHNDFLNNTPHAHFHQVGIGVSYSALFVKNKNLTFFTDTLVGQVIRNKVIGRPMHVLKMDIENFEWEIFKSLKDSPVLSLIGQIALEVHAPDLINKTMTDSDRIQYAQNRYNILRDIEARGFRMVAYWDNHQKTAYHDETGTRYELCGELLYVNTNWYNSTFKETLRKTYGFEFQAPS